jgi:hypothetical protein
MDLRAQPAFRLRPNDAARFLSFLSFLTMERARFKQAFLRTFTGLYTRRRPTFRVVLMPYRLHNFKRRADGFRTARLTRLDLFFLPNPVIAIFCYTVHFYFFFILIN